MVNDFIDNKILVYFLKYDLVGGVFDVEISYDDESIIVNGKVIKVFVECDFVNFLWGELGVDIVIELIGFFIKVEFVKKYIEVGVKKVFILVFGMGVDGMFVMGVNEDMYNLEIDYIIFNVLCIINCFVLLV